MTRIYFCGPLREVKMQVKKFHPHWSGPDPTNKTNYDPDPKIKDPKKPKKGGKKWPKKK